MKTIEFKLYLTQSQQSIIDDWLAALKYPWNKGVELINRFNEFNRYDKRFKASAPCCPIASYNHKLRIVNTKNRERDYALRENEYFSCPIGWKLSDYTGFSVSDTGELHQSLVDEGKIIEGVSKRSPFGIYPVRPFEGGKLVTNLTYFGLLPVFAHKRNLDKPWLTDVDSKFVAGMVKVVADSWQAFLDGNRKPPKFKGKNQRVDTLIHNNSKDIRIEGDRIKIPKIGWVRAKGLRKRWPQGVPFCPMKICRKASGYYLQLTGEIPPPPPRGDSPTPRPDRPPKVEAVGLDPGVAAVYTDDMGRTVKVPDYLERDTKKLKELQRKAQRQWDNNSGLPEWERKNWRKTQQKIAKLHEKIARRGRAFNHFESTKLIRQFKEIYLEDYRPSEMVGKVQPVSAGKMVVNSKDELTTVYEKNGREINRAINRATLRNRVGQLWQMIETKGGKRVVRVERSGTSSECPQCGHVKEKTIRERIHRCSQCGYTTHRDRAAAQVIKKRGQDARMGGCTKEGNTKKSGKRRSKDISGEGVA
jgi:putative transposase